MADANQDLGSTPVSGAGGARSEQRGLWILAAITASLFAVVAAVVDLNKPYLAMDLQVSMAVQSFSTRGLDELMEGVSWAGEDFLSSFLVVAISCCVFLVARAPRAALILFAAIALEQAAVIGVKNMIARPRPSHEAVRVLIHAHEYYSFPSGHTVHYTVLFGLLTFLTWEHVRPVPLRWLVAGVFSCLVILIGPARIYLGAHWVTDVIGGYLLGVTILSIAVVVYRSWGPA